MKRFNSAYNGTQFAFHSYERIWIVRCGLRCCIAYTLRPALALHASHSPTAIQTSNLQRTNISFSSGFCPPCFWWGMWPYKWCLPSTVPGALTHTDHHQRHTCHSTIQLRPRQFMQSAKNRKIITFLVACACRATERPYARALLVHPKMEMIGLKLLMVFFLLHFQTKLFAVYDYCDAYLYLFRCFRGTYPRIHHDVDARQPGKCIMKYLQR